MLARLCAQYCIIEVLTAIESRIPIVCVTVAGKPNDAYNFEEMSQMMLWMDSELEQWNTGASDVLRDHGYDDLVEVAYRLSTVVPKTIAVTLNTGASRNMLRATIEDVVSSIEEARSRLSEDGIGRDVPDKATWLAQREKMTRPTYGVAKAKSEAPLAPDRMRAPSASMPTQPTAPTPQMAPTMSTVPDVAPVAGQALIAAAATTPDLLPLAFTVQALASGGRSATVQTRECANAAAAAGPLERLLLATADGATTPLLESLNEAAEALAGLQARCSAKGAVDSDELGVEAFKAARLRLISSAAQLCASGGSPEGRTAAADLAKALNGQGVPAPLPPPPPPPPAAAPPPQAAALDAAMADALSAQQAQAEAARQQRELLEMQNKVLMEQVASMQKMMAAQQMSMQSFMSKFPQPPDEAERRLVLLKKQLMTAPRKDFAKVDDLLRNMIIARTLGPNCHVAMFNVIGEDEQRGISLCLALKDGGLLMSDDLPEFMTEQRTARKTSMCQYVVARGEYQCFTKQGHEGNCFMMDFMKKGVHLMEKDPETYQFIQNMRESDAKVDQTLGEMSALEPLMASDKEIDDLPTMRRLSLKMQRAMLKGMLKTASGTNTGAFINWMTSTFSAEDLTYIGAPVRCEGRVMGSLCGLFSGGDAGGPGDTIRDKLERAAGRLGAVLDEL